MAYGATKTRFRFKFQLIKEINELILPFTLVLNSQRSDWAEILQKRSVYDMSTSTQYQLNEVG